VETQEGNLTKTSR